MTYLERTIRAWQVHVDHHNYLLLHLQVLRDLSQDGVQLNDAQFLPTSTPRTYLGEMPTIPRASCTYHYGMFQVVWSSIRSQHQIRALVGDERPADAIASGVH